MEDKISDTNDNSMNLKKKILIVDDNENIRELMLLILEDQYTIITRNDGQEALDYLRQGNRPDLILSDMIMPNMNGRTFVRHVNSDPRFGQIPIVFITAVESDMLINSFKNKGIVDFIFKPVKPEELLDKVHSILQDA